jgi:hypothetical protein
MQLCLRLLAVCLALTSVAALAQTPGASPLPPVPTTRILAIGKLTGPRTPETMKLLASKEVPATVELYLNGKIADWYSLKEGDGVVFILNVTSVEEARAMLEKLPLGQAKLMKFDLIPLGPLRPLGLLLPQSDKPAN